MGLVTLAYAQARLPGVPPEALAVLIEAASARFEGEIGRALAAADYRETILALGGPSVLARYPAIRIDRVGANPVAALRVANPGAFRASASVVPVGPRSEAPAKLRLVASSGAGASAGEVPITPSLTLSALAAAVSALGDGWTASAEGGRGDHPADDLLIGTYAASGAGALLRADSEQRDADFLSSEDQEASIAQIRAWGQVRVWYRAGYEEIPADVQEAIVGMIAASLDPAAGGGSAIKKHSLGERDIEYFASAEMAAFPRSALSVINLYRDRRI